MLWTDTPSQHFFNKPETKSSKCCMLLRQYGERFSSHLPPLLLRRNNTATHWPEMRFFDVLRLIAPPAK